MTNADRDARHEVVSSPKLRRALRLAGWNALLLIAGLALIGLAGEAWLRWTVPFMPVQGHRPKKVFVPDVGRLLRPDSVVRWTNGLDFWTVSRTNRLGFLDREPPSPERAAQGCHIAMIGDSFVEAKEVPIADKFHVRLEEMAARELPTLDVTTSAFGRGGTGQINQLALYDAYARPLRPKLVVLVFVPNDFIDNFPLWESLRKVLEPDQLPYVNAARVEDGGFRLRLPDPPDDRRLSFASPRPQGKTLVERAYRASWFLQWLRKLQRTVLHTGRPDPEREIRARERRIRWMELLSRRPAYAPLLDEYRSMPRENLLRIAGRFFPGLEALFAAGDDSPFYTEALAFTAFGLDEFKKRAARDGAALAILTVHGMTRFAGGNMLARLNEIAAERGIPVVDQDDFILRQGAELRDAHWKRDGHWNPTGHRWAAKALLEYLKRNRDLCE